MEKENAKKIEKEISSTLLTIFFLFTLVIGAAIYFLPEYYFIKPDQEFDLAANYKPVINQKVDELKSYDFSIFNSLKFSMLKEGYWHVYDESTFSVGNPNPFEAKK